MHDIWEGIERTGPVTVTRTIKKVLKTEIVLVVTDKSANAPISDDFSILCDQTSTVTFTLFGKPQQSATFTGKEAKEICGGVWPTPDSLDNVKQSVIAQKAYPMPKPEIPGGGGKSKTAQGQTRKEGSHKDNTGHK